MALSRKMGERCASSILSLRAVFLIAVVLGLLIPASLIGALSYNLQREILTAHLRRDQLRLLDIVTFALYSDCGLMNYYIIFT